MTSYKRCYLKGQTYFFTLVTYRRTPLFTKTKNINLLKKSFRKTKETYPFNLNAFVILPDHLHCIWTMPKNDYDFSTRWRLIKYYFSINKYSTLNQRQEKQIWQRRFWEHIIRDECDWHNHMNYIHYNPVKHGLTTTPNNWPHSSFHYWVQKGLYEQHWGKAMSVKTPQIFTGE